MLLPQNNVVCSTPVGGYFNAGNTNGATDALLTLQGGSNGHPVTQRDRPESSIPRGVPLPASTTNGSFPVSQVTNWINGGGAVAMTAFDPNLVTLYVFEWSFGVQRELPTHTTMEVRYVGSHVVKQFPSWSANELDRTHNGLTSASYDSSTFITNLTQKQQRLLYVQHRPHLAHRSHQCSGTQLQQSHASLQSNIGEYREGNGVYSLNPGLGLYTTKGTGSTVNFCATGQTTPCFGIPGAGQFGNTAFDGFTVPRFFDQGLSILKEVQIQQRQFRRSSNSLDSTTFGQMTSTFDTAWGGGVTGRIVQFGVRLTF